MNLCLLNVNCKYISTITWGSGHVPLIEYITILIIQSADQKFVCDEIG